VSKNNFKKLKLKSVWNNGFGKRKSVCRILNGSRLKKICQDLVLKNLKRFSELDVINDYRTSFGGILDSVSLMFVKL